MGTTTQEVFAEAVKAGPPAAADSAAIALSTKSTVLGALTGLGGYVAEFNWIGLIGSIVAIAGLAANIYFQIRRDRREAAESDARIRAINERCAVK